MKLPLQALQRILAGPAAGLVYLVAVLLAPQTAAQYSVRLGAGGGPNGVPSTSYAIARPYSIAMHGGDVYFTSQHLHRIFRVTPAGDMYVVAGIGLPGYSGDGSAAIYAKLNQPLGLAVDAQGNLYFMDFANGRVRWIHRESGVIATLAESLGSPHGGIAVDSLGNVYFTDSQRVRKIAADTKLVTTVAGTGIPGYTGEGTATAVRLHSPRDVAVDATGNLYIADTLNQRIRKVSTSGAMTTIAGDGTAGFSGDSGPAAQARINTPHGIHVDPQGVVWIADTYNNRVRTIQTDNVIRTVAGNGAGAFTDGVLATAASLNHPTDMFAGAPGSFWIADFENLRARHVPATAIITTIAGNGSATPPPAGGDGQLAIDAWFSNVQRLTSMSGSVYVSDHGSSRVRRVQLSTATAHAVAGTGEPGTTVDALWAPSGLTSDAQGNLYIADSSNARVIRIQAGTGTPTVYAGTGSNTYSGDGGLATLATMHHPFGVDMDTHGNLFIGTHASPSATGARLRRVDAGTKNISTEACFGDQALCRSLDDVAVAPDGTVYMADATRNRIYALPPGGPMRTAAGTGSAGFGGDGALATSALLAGPTGIDVDAQGNLYIADTGNNRVRRVNAATGIITTIAGTGARGYTGETGPALGASFDSPSDIEVLPTGQVWVADSGNRRLRILQPPCTFALVPEQAQAPAGASTGTLNLNVVSGEACLWTVASNVGWITVTSAPTGTGNAVVTYQVSANAGSPRSGTITAGGRTFTVNQASTVCVTSVTPSTLNYAATPAVESSVAVAAPPGCAWMVSVAAPWVATLPLSSTGSGNLLFTAHPNFTSVARTATVMVGGVPFTITQAANAATAAQRFVLLLYYNFFGRLPAEAERVSWVTSINGGTSWSTVACNFFNSQEFHMGGRFVAGLYVGLLARDAEYSGWLFQRNALSRGWVDVLTLVNNFLNSDEYRSRFPNQTDAEFVRHLYRYVLGREPSDAEVAAQVAELERLRAIPHPMPRAVLAHAFLNSPEFRARTDIRLTTALVYFTLFFRDPIAAERAVVASQLGSGRTPCEIMAGMINDSQFPVRPD